MTQMTQFSKSPHAYRVRLYGTREKSINNSSNPSIRQKNRIFMKAKSKSELAAAAGVSLDTLRKWLKACQGDLEAVGYDPRARVLPPSAVKFLAEKYCIDVE